MPRCDAKCLLSHPSVTGSMMVASCTQDEGHDGFHKGNAVIDEVRYPTEVSWEEEDRRTYRGELHMCDETTCILPAGHRGNHVG